jgi:hypothetical protein
MFMKLTLGAAAIAAVACFAPVSAAPPVPQTTIAADSGLVQQVHRRHCHRVWHWTPYRGWHWHRHCHHRW